MDSKFTLILGKTGSIGVCVTVLQQRYLYNVIKA